MAEKHVDARGLACPQPVVLSRKAMLEDGVDVVRVVVDREGPAENIQRMARSQGWETQATRQEDEFHLTLSRGEATAQVTQQPAKASDSAKGQPDVVVFVTSRTLRKGNYGKKTLNKSIRSISFLHLLKSQSARCEASYPA